MDLVDREFVAKLVPYLLRVRERGADYNFRCPYCGDSSKSETKTRGWLIQNSDATYSFTCYNCNHPDPSMSGLIAKVRPAILAEYKAAKFKLHSKNVEDRRDIKKILTEKPVFQKPEAVTVEAEVQDLKFREFTRFSEVRPCIEHDWALEYIATRRIPYEDLINIYAVEDYRHITDTIGTYKNSKFRGGRAIVFPYYSRDMALEYLQIRTVQDKVYMTFEVQGGGKVWGRHRVNPASTIYLFEGAFDGICVRNGMASGGADLLRAMAILDEEYPETRKVMCFDVDYKRNRDVYDQVARSIAKGYNVTLMSGVTYKDANDMLSKGGMSGDEIINAIEASTYSGLKAKLELSKVKRPWKSR